jgi:hypothetical protein
MIRILAIAILLTIAYLIIRYGTNKSFQHKLVIFVGCALGIYFVSIMAVELFR